MVKFIFFLCAARFSCFRGHFHIIFFTSFITAMGIDSGAFVVCCVYVVGRETLKYQLKRQGVLFYVDCRVYVFFLVNVLVVWLGGVLFVIARND